MILVQLLHFYVLLSGSVVFDVRQRPESVVGAMMGGEPPSASSVLCLVLP